MKELIKRISFGPKKEELDKFQKFFAAHEFSRKINNWELFYVDNIPVPVSFVNDYIYLAGGAVFSLLNNSVPNDYDLFFVGKDPSQFLEKIRNSYDYIETIKYISIIVDNKNIQFIKRIYDSVDNVIGGFDLDECRLIMDQFGNVFTTATGYQTFKNKISYVNPACQSSSFFYRINKYRKRGIKHIHIGQYANVKNLYHNSDYSFAHKHYLHAVVSGLLKKKYKNLAIRNNELSLEKAIEYAKDNFHVSWYFNQHILRLTKGQCYLSQVTNEDIIKILTKRYNKYYANLKNIIITNPGRQFTGSFNPTDYSIKSIYGTVNFDLLYGALRIAFLAAKKRVLPRFIIFKIFRDYFTIFENS